MPDKLDYKKEFKDLYMPGFKILIYFFLISHGIPFLTTGIFMVMENSIYITDPLLGRLIYIGFLSPALAGLFVIYNFYNTKERNQYWFSIIDFKRISWKWYLIIVIFPIMTSFFASIVDAGFIFHNIKFSVSPHMTLSYAAMLLFFGPIPEELGWRGVALPELEKNFGFAVAVSFIGFMWAIWHLPLFFVEGTYQYQLGLFTPLFWNYMFGTFFISAVYGVIFNETNKSLLAVILFHYLDNLTGETFVLTLDARIISTVLRGVIALGILTYYSRHKAGKERCLG